MVWLLELEKTATALHVTEDAAATKLSELREQGIVGSLDDDGKYSNPLYDPRTVSIDSISILNPCRLELE